MGRTTGAVLGIIVGILCVRFGSFDVDLGRDYDMVNSSITTSVEINVDDQGLQYELDSTGRGYEVVGYQPDVKANIIIPTSFKGVTVVGIGDAALNKCANLTTVSIPRTVKRIEAQAFDSCENLRQIQLNEGLEYIGRLAFSGCTALSGEIRIPSTVKEIGDRIFIDATGITSIVFEDTNNWYEVENYYGLDYNGDFSDIPKSQWDIMSVSNPQENAYYMTGNTFYWNYLKKFDD